MLQPHVFLDLRLNCKVNLMRFLRKRSYFGFNNHAKSGLLLGFEHQVLSRFTVSKEKKMPYFTVAG